MNKQEQETSPIEEIEKSVNVDTLVRDSTLIIDSTRPTQDLKGKSVEEGLIKENPKVFVDHKKIVQVANIMNAPVVDNDVVLSMLLGEKILLEEDVDWEKHAEFHLKRSKLYAKRTDLRSKLLRMQFALSENVKMPKEQWAGYYKDWILENAKHPTRDVSVIIEPNRVKSEEGQVMIDLGKLRNTGFAEENLGNLLGSKKIDPKRTSLMVTDSPGFMGYYVYQNDKAYAQVKIENIEKPIYELRWKLKLEVDNIDMSHYNDMKYLFYHVRPIALQYKHPTDEDWKTAKDFLILNHWEKESKNIVPVAIHSSKAFFNYDVLLSMVLSNKLVSIEDIDWKFFAFRNFSNAAMDKTKKSEYQYPRIFANDFYDNYKPTTFPEGIFEHYKNWVVNSSDTSIKSIYQPVSKLKTKEGFKANKTQYTFTIGNRVSFRYSVSSNIIDFKGLDPKKVSLNTLDGNGRELFFKNIFFVYPETANLGISVELPDDLKIEPYDFSKNWRVELNLDRIEFDKINNQGYVFCYVKPKAIHYKTYDGNWHVSENFEMTQL
ncbi:hypothetical protein [Flagellimonas olearia]|nr:hypothetical protein [Allomuricauda olearia]